MINQLIVEADPENEWLTHTPAPETKTRSTPVNVHGQIVRRESEIRIAIIRKLVLVELTSCAQEVPLHSPTLAVYKISETSCSAPSLFVLTTIVIE